MISVTGEKLRPVNKDEKDSGSPTETIPGQIPFYKFDEEELEALVRKPVKLVCKSNVTDKTNNIVYPIACRDETKDGPLEGEGEYYFNCINDSCEIINKGDYSGLSSDVVSVEKETQTPKPSKKLPPPPGVSKNPKTVTQLRGINLVTAPIIEHLKKNIALPPPAGVSPVPNSVSGARNWSKFEYTTEEGKAIQAILIEIVDNKKDKKKNKFVLTYISYFVMRNFKIPHKHNILI